MGVSEHVAVELDPPTAPEAIAPEPEPTFTAAQVREIVFQANGAANGVLMQHHPDEPIPYAEVSRAIEAILGVYHVPSIQFKVAE